MPPLVSPALAPWFSPTGTTSTQAAPSSGNRQRFYATAGGPVTLPADWSDDDARQWVAAYDQHIAKLEQSWKETAGFQTREAELRRRQIEAQIEDAKQGRDNALELGRLQAETSRYGVDVASRDRMVQLRQEQGQFDARHGLDVAKAYTEYARTPDMRWSSADFDEAIGQVGRGTPPQSLASRVNAGDRPQAKTWQQFSVLANYGPGGGGGTTGATTDPMPGGSGSGSGGGDLRVKAADAIMKALPPSPEVGHNANNYAALDAIERLYFSADTPLGAVQQLGPARRKIAEAGLARKGYDPALVNEDYMRRQPGQGSVRSA